MNELNTNGLRGILDSLPTLQLQQMLDDELQKEKSDPAAVKLILTTLEARHAAQLKTGSVVSEEALQKYRAEMEELFPRSPGRRWAPLLRVASVVLILGLLFAVVPQKAEAETFWEMLQRLSNSVIEYFNPREHISSIEYEFKTDNPGLQKVYDAVAELGVTEPVVPMWLPEGYEITACTVKITPMLSGVWATFSNKNSEIVYKLDVYDGKPAHQYYRDETFYEAYEQNGTVFNISKNNEWWIVIWTKENVECVLSLDCQEETLRRILKSIYIMEDS